MRYQIKMSNLQRKYLCFKANIIGALSKLKSITNGNTISILKQVTDNRTKFSNQLSVVAIVKNEASYIQEWIEFHKLVGVTKFYLYDNESEDALEDVLTPYLLDGTVELHTIVGKGKQLEAYEKAIQIAKNETRWLAILDIDEFLLPLSNNHIIDILNEGRKSAMLIGWMVYGSNGFLKRPEGLVTKNYRKHATDDYIADYKSIVNPRKVIRIKNPHFVQVLGKITDENGKKIYQYPYTDSLQALPASKKRVRINHYYSKSLEEFEMKSRRGYADSSLGDARLARNMAVFRDHDQNVVEDNAIDEYIPKLTAALKAFNKE